MKRFFVLYRIPVATMDEWRKSTDKAKVEEQMQKMMADMNAWEAKHAKSFADKGAPLGKTKTVIKAGVSDSRNDLNYYLIVEADSHEAAAQIFADNPHLSIPTSSIDVMEIPHMGM